MAVAGETTAGAHFILMLTDCVCEKSSDMNATNERTARDARRECWVGEGHGRLKHNKTWARTYGDDRVGHEQQKKAAPSR